MSARVTDFYAQNKRGLPAKPLPDKRAESAAPPAPPPAPPPGTSAAAAPRFAPSPAQREADEADLRQFDLATAFGPCQGITRLMRWERAAKLGLAPPQQVKDTLLRYGPDSELNMSLWDGGKV